MPTKKKLTFAEKKARARALARGLEKREELSSEELEGLSNAQEMAHLYERFLGEYQYNTTKKYVNAVNREHKAFKYFLKAAEFADELNIPRDVYMKAQFHFIHQWKGRAPHTYELATYKQKNNSRDRALMYSTQVPTEQVKTKKITARYSAAKAPTEARFRNSESVLRKFMKTYDLTEEQIFMKFTPATAYFDREWLKSNEVYMRLKQSGEVK